MHAPGFKELVRNSVHVGSGEHPVVDVSLEVGATSQTVEVTADAPLLNSENASVGQVITTKEVENFPLDGGTPLMLTALSIAVLATGNHRSFILSTAALLPHGVSAGPPRAATRISSMARRMQPGTRVSELD